MNNEVKKGRPKTFNTEHANKIAMEIYWEEGIENVSLNEICRKIGESKPSVYREYGGEQGLQLAAFKLYYKKRIEPVGKILLSPEGFVKNLHSAFECLINSHFEENKSYSCMYNKESLYPSKNLSAECKNFIEKKDKEIVGFLKEAILEAIDKKEINKDINIEIYSEYIFNQIKLIAALSNKKLPKSVLSGMVDLIIAPLRNN